jgi:hypothetical protein
MIALLIVFYAAYVYFTDKGFRFTWITWLWQMFTNQWRQAGSAYRSWQRDRVRNDDTKEHGSGRRQRWFSWGKRKLEPNAQVRFYYLSLLKEAEARGIQRQQAETPLSYAPRLTAALPADPDPSSAVDELTKAFVQVRYSDSEIDATRLPALEQFWQYVRRILRM